MELVDELMRVAMNSPEYRLLGKTGFIADDADYWRCCMRGRVVASRHAQRSHLYSSGCHREELQGALFLRLNRTVASPVADMAARSRRLLQGTTGIWNISLPVNFRNQTPSILNPL